MVIFKIFHFHFEWTNNFSYFILHSRLKKDAGSDAANLSTVATKRGDEYVLNGHKAWYESIETKCIRTVIK